MRKLYKHIGICKCGYVGTVFTTFRLWGGRDTKCSVCYMRSKNKQKEWLLT